MSLKKELNNLQLPVILHTVYQKYQLKEDPQKAEGQSV